MPFLCSKEILLNANKKFDARFFSINVEISAFSCTCLIMVIVMMICSPGISEANYYFIRIQFS